MRKFPRRCEYESEESGFSIYLCGGGGEGDDSLDDGEEVCEGFAGAGFGLDEGVAVFVEEFCDGCFLDGGWGFEVQGVG